MSTTIHASRINGLGQYMAGVMRLIMRQSQRPYMTEKFGHEIHGYEIIEIYEKKEPCAEKLGSG